MYILIPPAKQNFDFLLSKDSILYAVEVKTVSSLKQNSLGEDFFECQLKSVRSNTVENTVHHFDNSILDFLAIVNLVDKKVKVIKASEITAKSALRVYRKDF